MYPRAQRIVCLLLVTELMYPWFCSITYTYHSHITVTITITMTINREQMC